MARALINIMLIMLAAALSGCATMDLYRSRLFDQTGPVKPGVSITWLGTAGVLVSDGRTGILIDPYVSRAGLFRVFSGADLHTDRELIRRWVRRLGKDSIQAVLVSHSHFDHALDAPYFALETGSPLFGSDSTRNIGLGAGLPENRITVVRWGRDYRVGDFTLVFMESRHGPAMFGRVPYPGAVEEPLTPPQPAAAYRLGTTSSILIRHPYGSILHHGSAGFIPGMYEEVHADVVLLGIAGRGDTREYLAEVPLKVKARTVIPIHFDDFFKPLDSGLSFLHTWHFAEFCSIADTLQLTVRTVPVGEPVRVLPPD